MIGYYHAISHLDPLVDRLGHRIAREGGWMNDAQVVNSIAKDLKKIQATSNLHDKIAALIDTDAIGHLPRVGATGTFCAKAYSLMGASSDVVQATESAQPLLLRYEGYKYLHTPGNTSGLDNMSTPDAPVNRIYGDIEIKAYVDGTATKNALKNIYRKGSYDFDMGDLGEVFFRGVFATVLTTYQSTANLPTRKLWVRVTRSQATGEINFYYNLTNTPTDIPTSWIQLGATVTGLTGLIDSSASNVFVGGSGNSGVINIYRCLLNDAIGGNPVVEFNAEDYDISVSQNTLTSSSSGEIWTLNRSTATSGSKAALVDRTQIQGNRTASTMASVPIVINQPFTSYSVIDQFTYTASAHIISLNSAGTCYPLAQSGGAPNLVAGGGVNIPYVGEALNSLKHYMAQINGASSITGINGVYQAPTNAGAVNGDNIYLFNYNNIGLSNAQFNTLVIAKQADDLATRNLMNDFIRDLNGNPAT